MNNSRETIKSDLDRTRPPVVVVLGHVDHGKTSLLDTIRRTKIAESESGGITQHIGAYQVEIPSPITFIDTPGHEAFTAIRARGTGVADMAILVVAADESVKPQTKEAIKIIQESGIPMIVAINKIDKEGSNVQKVKQDLAGENVLVEDWGGKIPVIEISAKQNKNIDALLEMILLVSELEDLKIDTSLPAEGVIIESRLDKRKGYVATALVQKGILKLGDWIVVGTGVGKIKSMGDFMDRTAKEAVPSQPVQIVGWSFAPGIGKKFISSSSKSEAEKIANRNTNDTPLFKAATRSTNEISKEKTFNIILKSDVSSSLEAIDLSLGNVKSEEVAVKIINYGVGNIGERDIKMAIGSGAQIIGFRVGAESAVKKLAEKESVKLVLFDVIYELIKYIRKEMGNLLKPEIRRNFLGKIKILAVFKNESKYQIVGGKVTSGKVLRGALTDAMRNNTKLISGKIIQLQHNKQDIGEVKEGLECGLKFEKTEKSEWEIKEGDVLEVYNEEKIARSL